MSIAKTFLALIIASSFAVSFAFAQRTNTKRKSQPRTTTASSPGETNTRARRTTATSTPEPTTAQPETNATVEPSPESAASPQSTPASESKPKEKPAEKPAQQPEEKAAVTAPVVKDPIKDLREQIDAAPTSQDKIRLQLELAEQLLTNGKKSEAVVELQSITAADVFDPQTFYNTGNASARLGETNLAVTAYRKAIEQRKGRYSRASNNLGVILMRAGRWDEAQDAFQSALRVESFRYAEASYNLGRLYAARGETDLAIREWRRALAVNPQHEAAKQSIARAGNEDQIIVVEQPANTSARETNAPLPPPVTSTSAKPVSAANKAPARNSKQKLALDPTSFNFLQMARSASERGNKLEAVENYQRLISRQNGYFGPANLELGYVLISLKRNDEALTTLLSVANREGARYPISYYHVARIYEGRGELKLAEEAFVRASAGYRNENIQFLLDLSRIREKQGDFKGALEAMEQFVSLATKNGFDVVWSEERLTALRQKATVTTPK